MTTTNTLNASIIKVTLAQAARALRVGFIADYPIILWGPVGLGKSSIVRQAVPKGWKLYDVRLSDKEASDLGGIPMPDTKTGRVRYMMPDLLPWDTDEKCVVLFDEFDRSTVEVLNAMLQIVLDRAINGHRLSKNARIVLAGNGATDIGTIPITSAAAARMCHLYIEDKGEPALSAWLDWASNGAEVSPSLVSFAKYRTDDWFKGRANVPELENLAHGNERNWVAADSLYRACGRAEFETGDIRLPLMAGCVGKAGAISMLGWYQVCEAAPTLEQIVADPNGCKLPDEMGVCYSLGLTIAKLAYDGYKNGELIKRLEAFATYIARWPDEQASFGFTHFKKAEPRVATTRGYQQWQAKRSSN